MHRFRKASFAVQNRRNNSADTKQHDDTLYKIIDRRSHITAGNNVDSSQNRHNDNAYGKINIEGHSKQSR